ELGMNIAGSVLSEQVYGQEAMAALGVGVQVGVLLPYGRAQESEADDLGLTLMAQAGFDPRHAVILWQRMAAQEGTAPVALLSTHPSSQTRISQLQAWEARALPLMQQAHAAGRRPQCKR
ncbi:MAG: M48 family metalloprotease, partial [Plesiomonas shigelloides]